MCFHSIFILNNSGEVQVEKHYKGLISRNIFHRFIEELQNTSSYKEVSPIIETSKSYLVNVLVDNLFFVGICSRDNDVLLLIEFLNRISDIFKSYFGKHPLNEEILRENIFVIYQLLDEICDGGWPLVTENNILKEMIIPPTLLGKFQDKIVGTENVKSVLPDGSLSNTYWRNNNVKYIQNSFFLDIFENLNLVLDRKGGVLCSEIIGEISGNSQLSGTPNLHLKFMNSSLFDDFSFHKCVHIPTYQKEKVISFIPPDGEFKLMEFKILGNFTLPFFIKPYFYYKNDAFKINISISKLLSINEKSVENLVLRIFLPAATSSAPITSTVGTVSFNDETKVCTWDIGKLPHGSHASVLDGVLTLSSKPQLNPIIMVLKFNDWVNSLLELDYVVKILDNEGGNFCSTYPLKIPFLISVKGIKKLDLDYINCLESLILNSHLARVRGRFPVPVLHFNGKNICRSSTLSNKLEMVYRSLRSIKNSLNELYASSLIIFNNILHTFRRDTDSRIDSSIINRYRKADIRFMKILKISHINDLMVEKDKRLCGFNIYSSEKSDSSNVYNKYFRISSIPYPGVEFFTQINSPNISNCLKSKYDWNIVENPSELFLDNNINNLEVKNYWNSYKAWDLLLMTKNYLKFILYMIVDNRSTGILMHCISGWDRTPLFISLIRLSLWADGVIHNHLSADQILFLTITYDWMLFQHQFAARKQKDEDIFSFCFFFLGFISSYDFSIQYVQMKVNKCSTNIRDFDTFCQKSQVDTLNSTETLNRTSDYLEKSLERAINDKELKKNSKASSVFGFKLAKANNSSNRNDSKNSTRLNNHKKLRKSSVPSNDDRGSSEMKSLLKSSSESDYTNESGDSEILKSNIKKIKDPHGHQAFNYTHNDAGFLLEEFQKNGSGFYSESSDNDFPGFPEGFFKKNDAETSNYNIITAKDSQFHTLENLPKNRKERLEEVYSLFCELYQRHIIPKNFTDSKI